MKTLRGETVSIQGYGLYKYDSVSGAAQGVGQDIITLLVGIPTLIFAAYLYLKNSLRGKLLLAGILGYFLYTYTSYAMLMTYNMFFLLYVALFSMSLFALIMTLLSIELKTLPQHFSSKFPRKTIANFLIIFAVVVALMWIGRIVPALLNNGVPTGLENYTTLVIQVMDLGIIVPILFLGGVLLLKQSYWGYLLASVIVFKGLTMGLALCAMMIWQAMAGVQMEVAGVIAFTCITIINLVFTIIVFRNVREDEPVNTRILGAF
jgi:hypothetical protein